MSYYTNKRTGDSLERKGFPQGVLKDEDDHGIISHRIVIMKIVNIREPNTSGSHPIACTVTDLTILANVGVVDMCRKISHVTCWRGITSAR